MGRTHFLLIPSKINGFSDFIFHFFAKWGKNGANYIFISQNLKLDGTIKKPLYASRKIISPIGKRTFNDDVYVAVSYRGGSSFSFCDIYINENPTWSGWLHCEGNMFDTTPYFYVPKGQPIYATLSGDVYESRFLIVPCE